MKRFFPYPFMSLVIFAMWLMLAGTYSPASFVFATILAICISPVMRVLEPQPVRPKNPLVMLKLAGIVLQDIIRSNIAVAFIILCGKKRPRASGFIHVPLTMKSPYGLAVLSIIITSTPGTLWVQYDSRSGVLLMHILDLVDKEEWIRLIQNRYERLLVEIFE